jgi:hypothetical protein
MALLFLVHCACTLWFKSKTLDFHILLLIVTQATPRKPSNGVINR